MSKNDANAGFTVASASKSYNLTAFLLVVLVLATIGLQHYTLGQQRAMTLAASQARYEYALVQRMALLVATHRQTQEEHLLAALREINSEFMVVHDNVAPFVLAAMGGASADAATMTANGLDKTMRGFAEKSFGYVATALTGDAGTFADAIAAGALNEIPPKWTEAVNAYIETSQKKILLYTRIGFGLLGLALVMLAIEAYSIVFPALRYITQLREHIDHMAATDQLTGFYNRAMLFKVAAMLMSGAKRHKQEVAAMSVMIDDFKALTDRYGRAAGDAAIKALAGVLREVLRNSDVMGRVSGEEFSVFLPATNEYRAAYVAEKVRAAIESLAFSVKENMIELRVSVGTAELQPHHKTPDDLLRAAEAGQRHALESGGNRVSTFTASKSGQPAPAPGKPGAAGASATPAAPAPAA